MALKVVPLTLKEANKLVESLHRHHFPVVGHRFSLGAVLDGTLVGACVCGRPVSRMVNATTVLEITRLVTDGTKNACSVLYAAAARVAREMGFQKIQTYILATEPGTSLLASGWILDGLTKGGNWNCAGRGGKRREDQPMGKKQRWAKYLTKDIPEPPR